VLLGCHSRFLCEKYERPGRRSRADSPPWWRGLVVKFMSGFTCVGVVDHHCNIDTFVRLLNSQYVLVRREHIIATTPESTSNPSVKEIHRVGFIPSSVADVASPPDPVTSHWRMLLLAVEFSNAIQVEFSSFRKSAAKEALEVFRT